MLFKANFIKKKNEKILSFKTSWKGLVPPTIYGILNTIEILIEVKRNVFCIEQILIWIVCYSRLRDIISFIVYKCCKETVIVSSPWFVFYSDHELEPK